MIEMDGHEIFVELSKRAVGGEGPPPTSFPILRYLLLLTSLTSQARGVSFTTGSSLLVMIRAWIFLGVWAALPAQGQAGPAAIYPVSAAEPAPAVLQALQDEVDSLM